MILLDSLTALKTMLEIVPSWMTYIVTSLLFPKWFSGTFHVDLGNIRCSNGTSQKVLGSVGWPNGTSQVVHRKSPIDLGKL